MFVMQTVSLSKRSMRPIPLRARASAAVAAHAAYAEHRHMAIGQTINGLIRIKHPGTNFEIHKPSSLVLALFCKEGAG
jgi:hypothetical protein